MRTYPRNSPEAAARLVALTALADGHLGQRELQVLEQRHAAERLGLTPQIFSRVLRELSEDLMATVFSQWGTAHALQHDLLPALLAEVDDPALRETILALCVDVAQADCHLSDTECGVIAGAVLHWQGVHHGQPSAVPVR